MPAPSCRFVAAGKRHDFAIEARSKQGGEAVRKQRQQSSDEVKRGGAYKCRSYQLFCRSTMCKTGSVIALTA